MTSAENVDGVIFAFSATNTMAQTVFCWHSTEDGRRFALGEALNGSDSRSIRSCSTRELSVDVQRRSEGSIEHIAWFVNAGEFPR